MKQNYLTRKMNKNKSEDIAQLVGLSATPAPAWEECHVPDSKVKILALALDTISRGSKYRQDVIEIIKGCYPDYYNDPNNIQIKEDDEDTWIFSVEKYVIQEDEGFWMGCGTEPTMERANELKESLQQKFPSTKFRIQKWKIN